MLESTLNISKNDKKLEDWIIEEFPTNDAKERFFLSHYYPNKSNLKFEDFENFFEKRKQNLRNQLIKKFSVKIN